MPADGPNGVMGGNLPDGVIDGDGVWDTVYHILLRLRAGSPKCTLGQVYLKANSCQGWY